MKVMTLGNGFVADHLPYPKIKERVQVDWKETRNLLATYRPSVLINAIGFCGMPNIDQCERQQSKTAEANITIPILLAEICGKLDIRLIHLGSGCIYFGESPNRNTIGYESNEGPIFGPDLGWKEIDYANPQSYYSRTKYATDLAIGQMPHVAVLRLRMPISDKNNPRNLINKLRGYKQVIDVPNSMTMTSDLVRCIDWTIQQDLRGIYHVVNPEPLNAAQIMHEWQKYDPTHSFDTITEDQLDKLTLAKRSNCILDGSKLANTGFVMTPSQEALQQCMAQYAKNIKESHVQ